MRGAPPITLINGEKLLDLVIDHQIGVRKKVVESLELGASALVAAASREEERDVSKKAQDPS